jgi:hypothetical protein
MSEFKGREKGERERVREREGGREGETVREECFFVENVKC